MSLKLSALHIFLLSQFFSAFADSAVLFIIQAIIKRDIYPEYYLPVVQNMFILPYILLSPWVGLYADSRPKKQVLLVGNAIKTIGVLLLLTGINPAVSYAVSGIGSSVYSPAKYGILPYLARADRRLMKANSGLESSTITAVLTGSVTGGFLSDYSISLGIAVCTALYAAAMGLNTKLPKNRRNKPAVYKQAVRHFTEDSSRLLRHTQGRYSLIGSGAFWMITSVLQMIVFSWMPLHLGLTSGVHTSMIIAVTSIGVAAGAMLSPQFVTLRTYRRTVRFGLLMAAALVPLIITYSLPIAVVELLTVGCLGGIYIVPLNAGVQQIGRRTTGSGRAASIQNCIKNVFMFAGITFYVFAMKAKVPVDISLAVTAAVAACIAGYLYWISRPKKEGGNF